MQNDSPTSLPDLDELESCLLKDRGRLRSQLRRAQQQASRGQLPAPMRDRLISDIKASQHLRTVRYQGRPRPAFDSELPVVLKRDEIAAAILANQVVVLCGETGSGKTTQLPKICLDIGRGTAGFIGHTQPRRIAARSVANRLASELGTSVGNVVGYKVRFNDRTRPETYVKLMTDGILLAETQHDRLLEQYDTIIIDEAHERSLNIDFLFGYIKQLLPKRPDLKVIIMSATIDPQRFSKHFFDAPIIEVSGRTYPVEIRYRALKSEDPEEEDREQLQGILEAVDELAREGDGDVLVFLPGEREIREAAEELRKHHPPQTQILPLYARLSADEQQKIFQTHSRRRIILSTNVAETSLTVPGIRYVVDTGLARISRYSPRNKVQRLPIEPISQASANQRAGRCGRVAEGVCIRLYSEKDFLDRPAFTEPEILRTNLAAVILQMMGLGLGHIDQFPFLEPPDTRMIRDGYLSLHEINAIDEENRLTEIGRHLAKLPIDPRIGRMVLQAEQENCLHEVLIIAAALSVQDPRDRPTEMQTVADDAHKQFIDERGDFFGFLKIWDFFREKSKHLSNSQLRKQVKNQFLSYVRLREWHEVHQQLNTLVTESGWQVNRNEAHADAIHRALLSGLLSNVGNKNEKAEYNGPRSLKFFIHPGSSMFKVKPTWIMAAELVETTKLYARTIAKIDPVWIERAAKHLITRTYTDPEWNAQRGDVIAGERVALKGLVLVPHRTVSYGPIDPRTSRELFIHHALVEGELRTGGEFYKHNMRLLHEVRELEAKARRRDLLADAPQRFAFFHNRVPGDVFNARLFETWRKKIELDQPRYLFMSLADVARPEAAEVNAKVFPDELSVGNLRFKLSYVYDTGSDFDGITAHIPLAVLNQTPSEPFEWLVPGYLAEKIEELIRSLPKTIRTQLVPAPDSAKKAAAALADATNDAPFLDSVAHQLGKLIGQVIPRQTFDVDSLPTHLKMNFRIVDEAGKQIAHGRDLRELKNQLGIKARESFASAPPKEFTRDGLTHWDFDDLPERVEIHRAGSTYSGFPALVDRHKSVSLRVMDSVEAARQANRDGVRRLFMLQLQSEMSQLARSINGRDQLALHYKRLGPWNDLLDDLLSIAVDRALFTDHTTDIRTRDEFVAKAKDGWKQMSQTIRQLNELALESLKEFHYLSLELSEPAAPMLIESIEDMRQQLAALMPPHFLRRIPAEWLPQLPRYLKAISIRLQKLHNTGLMRDRAGMEQLKPLLRELKDRQAAAKAKGVIDVELQKYRWMLEELRISLFAQEMKTSIPISPQRLMKQLSLVGA